MMEPPLVFLLGLPFHQVSMEEALDRIEFLVERGEPAYGTTPNVDFVAQGYNDPDLKQILFYSGISLCDGKPLLWLSRWFQVDLPERVAGSDLVLRLFQRGAEKGWKFYLFGSDDPTLEEATAVLKKKHTHLSIVGAESPPVGSIDSWDNEAITQRIRSSGADILLVALGCPKQERWIYRYLDSLQVPFSIGIGASLDFVAGKQVRAPGWMQKVGLEWFWRMIHHPGRLIKRYGKDFLYLLRLTWLQWNLTRKKPWGRTRGESRPPQTLSDNLLIWKGAIERDSPDPAPIPDLVKGDLICDVSGVRFMDSSGIGRLATLGRRVHDAGKRLVLLNPSPPVGALLRQMKLENQFPVAESPEEAMVTIGLAEKPLTRRTVEVEQRLVCLQIESDLERLSMQPLESILHLEADLLEPGWTLQLNLEHVRFIDSHGIGFLVGLKKRCQKKSIRLLLAPLSPAVKKAFHLMRLEEVFEVNES